MEFIINIANRNIRINSVYPNIYNTCKDYLSVKEVDPDIEIVIDEKSLSDEYRRMIQIDKEVPGIRTVEKLLVQRMMAESLLDFDTFLMHGAVVAYENKAYLFTAQSGTGKTTHIQKWVENIRGTFIVNGDKPLIMLKDNCVYACGTPWCGKERMGTNAIVPLRSIVFMERSDENRINRISFKTSVPLLLEQTYRPADINAMRKTLRLIKKLEDSISFYKFNFNNYKEDAHRVSFDALTSQRIRKP